jgi:hypothetical protein
MTPVPSGEWGGVLFATKSWGGVVSANKFWGVISAGIPQAFCVVDTGDKDMFVSNSLLVSQLVGLNIQK